MADTGDVVYSAEKATVKVMVRLRPSPEGKSVEEMFSFVPEKHILRIRDPTPEARGEHEYAFDEIFNVDTTQEMLFEKAGRPLCDHVLNGFNACCFAYGQTGSGKTYSMVGEGPATKGLIPRSIEYIFSLAERRSAFKRFEIFVSFIEIYLDQIRDLGDAYLEQKGMQTKKAKPPQLTVLDDRPPSERPSSAKTVGSASGAAAAPMGDRPYSRLSRRSGEPYEYVSLNIRERPNGEVYVEDLSLIPVTNPQEVQSIIAAGFAQRQTYETLMNPVSSRSHTLFTLIVRQTDKRDETDVITGKLNLVDLAGSERLARSHSEGLRMKEAAIINKSLSALGNVVMALDSGQDRHIPYRDSKLTRVLTDSLGGNSYCSVLATLNPSTDNYEECAATLQFANRCRNVTNTPVVNYVDTQGGVSDRRVKKLLMEIADLREQLKTAHSVYQKQIEDLKRGVVVGSAGPGAAGAVGRDVDLEKYLARMKFEQKSLLEKIDRRKADFKAVQERVRQENERQLRTQRELRGQIADLHNSLEVRKLDLINAMNEQLKAHEEELNQVIEHNHMLLMQQNELIRRLPEIMRARMTQARQAESTRAAVAETYDRKMVEERRALDEANALAIAQIKEQYQYFLDQRKKAYDELEAEYNAYKAQAEADKAAMQGDFHLMMEYARKLGVIVENMERGSYSVWDRSGLRGFVVPLAHKPAPLDPEQFKALKSLVVQADKFITKQEQGRALTSRSGRALTSRSGPAVAASPSKPSLGGSVRPASAETDIDAMSVDALRREVAVLRAQLRDAQSTERRAGLREQMENDLAAHPTIEYIRRLEDESARYKALVQSEQRRVRQLQAALDAKDRLLQSTQARAAGSGAMTARPALGRPMTSGAMK